MAILTMTTFVTLDGVMQAPGGPREDPSGGFTHGGWVFPHADAEFGEYITDIFGRASAFLLGRRTYEIFAGHWPRVTDPQDPIATKLNGLPKYVASKTLTEARWNLSTIVRDVVSEVRSLKTRLDGELQVHGSADLAQTLLQQGLVDEFNVATVPVVLGKGKRLFGAGTTPLGLELKRARTTTTGAVLATYRPAGAPKVGSFELAP